MTTTQPDARADGASQACCSHAPLSVPKVEEFLAMSERDLIARYRRGVENYDRRVFWLNESQMDTAFLPEAGVGRWPVRVLLGHLADAEIVFVQRMRRVVGEESPIFQVWDENSFIDTNIYGISGPGHAPSKEADEARVASALGGFVAVVHTLRQWTGLWLESLPESAFARHGLHPQRGEQTLRTILAYDTWHVEHHARFLRLKLDKLIGEDEVRRRLEEEGKALGGCGSGCGCAAKK